MGKRRSSRELALKFLYQFELNEGDLDEQIKLFLERNSPQEDVANFMKELVVSLIDKMEEIDEIIQEEFLDNEEDDSNYLFARLKVGQKKLVLIY